MRSVLISFVLAAVSFVPVLSTPMGLTSTKVKNVDDSPVLALLLAVEHLENGLYQEGLQKYNETDFKDAGIESGVRSRFMQMADHEKEHVKLWNDALGSKAVQPCTYSFPYEDVSSFVILAGIIENLVVSVYIGVSEIIGHTDHLTASAILPTEARQASYITAVVQKYGAWGGSTDTPLTLTQSLNPIASFIETCPTPNPVLQQQRVYPALSFTDTTQPGQLANFSMIPPSNTTSASNNSTSVPISNSSPSSNSTSTSTKSTNSAGVSPGAGTVIGPQSSAASANTTPTYIIFLSGLNKVVSAVTSDSKVMIPDDSFATGQVYAYPTNSKDLTDDTIVGNPAILVFQRDSDNQLMQTMQLVTSR